MDLEPVQDEATFTAQALGVEGHAYDEHSVIVKFRDTVSVSSVGDALSAVGGKFEDRDFDRKDDRFTHVAGGRLALVELEGKFSAKDAMARLAKHPAIEYVEPNYIVSINQIPNDPQFGSLYGLHNTGQSGGTVGSDISAVDAWDTTVGSNDVIVGVVDTGVDFTHPDLAGNIFVNPGEIPGNNVDDDANGYVDDVHGINAITGSGNPMDDNDHGTHVSGTIGATGNNAQGVVGVNWNVTIMGLKFLSGSGSGTTADAIECINYAVAMKVNHGVNIRALNNSWGGGGFSQALFDAIAAANNAEILFVAAAGNSNTNNDTTPNFPSNYDVPNVLAVASTTRTDARSSFSSFGATTVDMGAPGSDILSTIPGNAYATFSGTSMATPHVTGAAALVLSLNDQLTVAELKEILMTTGDPVASLAGITVSGKRLNVAAALEEADPQPSFKLAITPASQTITQNQSASYAINVTSVFGFTSPVSLSVSSTPALNATTSFTPNPAPVDSIATLNVATTTATAPGTYTVTITGTSGTITKNRTVTLTVRPEGTVERSFTNNTPVSIPDNNATGITSTLNITENINIFEFAVAVNITHTFIGDLVVELVSPAGTVATLHNREGGSTDNLNATFRPTAFNGQSTVGAWTLRVRDVAAIDVGTLNSWTITVVGVPAGGGNTPPTASFTASVAGLTASFTDTSTDANGTIASRSWNFGDGGTSTAQNPSHTYAAAGTYTVTLTVTDNGGATATATQSVTVTSPNQPITLSVVDARRRPNNGVEVSLAWTGATTANVEIFRNGVSLGLQPNSGTYRDRFRSSGASFSYMVCNQGGSVCSNTAVASF
jgi:subtilisin family serine protease/subtilisin-like proprotein convertase family protein